MWIGEKLGPLKTSGPQPVNSEPSLKYPSPVHKKWKIALLFSPIKSTDNILEFRQKSSTISYREVPEYTSGDWVPTEGILKKVPTDIS